MVSTTLAKFEGKYYGPSTALESSVLNNNNSSPHFETTAEFISTTVTSKVMQVSSSANYLSPNRDEAKILISMCLTFFTGIFHVSG